MCEPLYIELSDGEWPLDYIDHDRRIVRAVVFDDELNFYFVRADRDDIFGRAVTVETAGGGVESGESLDEAVVRELHEELGAEVEVVAKLGVVSDFYNLIHRHNINNYFLCRVKSFGKTELTDDEINRFHLSTLKLGYREALDEYELRKSSRLGRLIAKREVPILLQAGKVLEDRIKPRE